MKHSLVIGAGISGAAAALELARLGSRVTVLESGPRMGGKVLSYCCKASPSCSRCGACVAHETLSQALAHPGIRFITSAAIRSVKRREAGFTVTGSAASPSVDNRACTDCGACVKACPVKSIQRYARGGLVLYEIIHSRCLRAQGKKCSACGKACSASAVRLDEQSSFRVNADSVLVAIGHETFSPTAKPRLGYGRLPGVLTGLEAEEALSRGESVCARKPVQGEQRSIAFIQCVGSRDPGLGRNYCSAVCCAYALRMARRIAGRDAGTRVTVYCIDVQNFDKAFTAFRGELGELGVQIVHGLPSAVQMGQDGRLSVLTEDGQGAAVATPHDAVVLSVGIGPAADSARIAELFGLERDEHGFLLSGGRVFTAGTCREPQGILDSIADARAAVFGMVEAGLVSPPRAARAAGKRILVAGSGRAGEAAARAVTRLGFAAATRDIGNLAALEGTAGGFTAVERGGNGDERPFGAVIAASEALLPAENPFAQARVVPLKGLADRLAAMRGGDVPKSLAILLDYRIEETTEGSEEAFHAGIQARETLDAPVWLILHDARVSGCGLSALYDKARNAGVRIIHYTGHARIDAEGGLPALEIRDEVLRETVRMSFGLLAVSAQGLRAPAEEAAARALGIGLDPQGRLQENNVHLLPALTGRPGVFVVAGARVERDARCAALDARLAVSARPKKRSAEHPVVDGDLCALCLTCIRSCPAHAMRILDEEKRADCAVEACVSCGTCVGECPAGAISIPAWPRNLAGAG